MADTAVVEAPPAAPAAPAAPAGASSTSPPGEGAGAKAPGEGGTSAQPAGDGGGDKPAGAPSLPEGHVPWGKFREVQTQATRQRREWGQAEQRYQQQIREMQEQSGQLAKYRDDYKEMEQLLQANPDLAEALVARARGGAQKRPAAGAAELPPDVRKSLESITRLEQRMSELDRQREVNVRQQEDRQLSDALDQRISTLSKERNVSDEFAPFIRAYVMDKARQYDDLTLDDVPFIYGEFHRALEGEIQRRLRGSVDARRADLAGTPPAGGMTPGAPVVGGKPEGSAAKVLEQMLQERGWNNSGG